VCAESALGELLTTNKASIEIIALHVKTFSVVYRSGVDCLRQIFFLRWQRIFVVPQCGICFISPFWRNEFGAGF